MSIPVELADLERTLADFGAGYLLTTIDGRVRAVSAAPAVVDGHSEARRRVHDRAATRGSRALKPAARGRNTANSRE